MVRLTILVYAIPSLVAILLGVTLLTQPDIPFSAANPNDSLYIEYTKLGEKTEILSIQDGDLIYLVTQGTTTKEANSRLDEGKSKMLTAMIKETGFMTLSSIPSSEYERSILKITLNGIQNKIQWPKNNTGEFIPPIITMVENALDEIIKERFGK